MAHTSTLVLWYWGLGQATAIGMLALGTLALGRRLAPATRARVAHWTLWLMCAAPVAMLLPVDTAAIWNRLYDLRTINAGPGDTGDPAGETGIRQKSGAISELALPVDGSFWNAPIVEASQLLTAIISSSETASGRTQATWRWGWLAFDVMASFIAWGIVRVIVGQMQIGKIVREATQCADARVLRIGKESERVMDVTVPIRWLHHSSLGTPAVVGARKPSVVLPEDCLTWSDMQLRCAILHELAHIRRNDVWTTLFAQVSLALNYFHPLGHLLANRMRLDQELAADCLAAPHAGGQMAYLETLAALALRPVEPQYCRPALAFFPSRRTFVRRIEMLRTLRIASTTKCYWQSAFMLFFIVTVALLAMTLRPTMAQQIEKPSVPSAGAATTPIAAPDASSPDLLSYLPDSVSGAVIVMNVDAIIQSPSIAPTFAQLSPETRNFNLPNVQLPLDDMQALMAIVSKTMDPNQTIVVVRFKPGRPLPRATKPSDSLASRGAVQSYGNAASMEQLDARTLLIGTQAQQLAPIMRITASNAEQGELRQLVRRHPNSSVAIALRTSTFRPLIEKSRPEISALSPMWTDVTTGSAGITLNDSLDVDVILDSTKPKSVLDTLMAVRVLAQNAISTYGNEPGTGSKTPPDQVLMMQLLRGVAIKVFNDIKITEGPSTVSVSAKIDHGGPTMLGLLLPAIQANRVAALRSRATNSLKQIGLALHNYHDTYGRFPPSIVEENGVQRSWRVELLPFMEQAALYNMYRKDEPWNSPNNQKVGQTLVTAYSQTSSGLAANSNLSLTPIRGIGGPHGVLGKKISQITDGTSNTIIAVNVKEMVPWTQPDEYAPTSEELIKSAPDNYFLAAFADGAVRGISTSVNPEVLAALMTMDGGETTTVK